MTSPTHFPSPLSPIPLRARAWETTRSSSWLIGFILLQIACQLLLLVEALEPVRMFVRVAAMSASLAMFFILPPTGTRHPASRIAVWIFGVLALSAFHPSSNTVVACLAVITFNLSIIAPLFWAPRLQISMQHLRKVLFLVWAFQLASSCVGILQVYYPSQFQLKMTQVNPNYANLKYKSADGREIFRPSGLTDMPGGSAPAATFTVLFGMGFLITSRRRAAQALYISAILAGVACLYLTHVRVFLVMLGIGVCALVLLLFLRGDKLRALALAVLIPAAGCAGWVWAISVGGDATRERIASLVADNPVNVYHSNRGFLLKETIDDLPKYWMGAGLGRWGMMNAYFGKNDVSNPSLWAEVQWTGWIYDGGIPLVLAYVATLFAAFRVLWRLSWANPVGDLTRWSAVILVYTLATVAGTFDAPVFSSQSGMDAWLLNGALFAAACATIGPAAASGRAA